MTIPNYNLYEQKCVRFLEGTINLDVHFYRIILLWPSSCRRRFIWNPSSQLQMSAAFKRIIYWIFNCMFVEPRMNQSTPITNKTAKNAGKCYGEDMSCWISREPKHTIYQ